jgi:S1-C subfamily serine protease
MTTMRAVERSVLSIGLVICSALAALIILAAVLVQYPQTDSDAPLSAVQPVASATIDTTAVPTEPAVVSEHEMLHRTFRALARVLTDDGLGTGFVYRSAGEATYFVTNAHVVDQQVDPIVRTSDGVDHPAVVVGRDDGIDLAVLSVTSVTMNEPLLFADSETVIIAEPLYVIGYVLGSNLLGDPTVTKGVLSGRRVIQGVDYVQTDAAVNPGNSGGPVINAAGEVVGMASWRIRRAGYEPVFGISFAIPSNTIVSVAENLIAEFENSPSP